MDIKAASQALSALAQPSRLRTFRLLVQRGASGMAAGDIARALGLPHNTLSSHLGILAQAGLVHSRRQGRSVIYSIAPDGLRALLGFLLQDCCQGQAQICAPLLDAVLPAWPPTEQEAQNHD